MTKKFWTINILSFLAFFMVTPQISTGGIWVAVASMILLGIIFMTMNFSLKGDTN